MTGLLEGGPPRPRSSTPLHPAGSRHSMHSSALPATETQQPLSPCQLLGWVPPPGALRQAWGVGSIPQGVGGISLAAMQTVPGICPWLLLVAMLLYPTSHMSSQMNSPLTVSPQGAMF